MNDERDVAVTGVAKGSLGTGANLEDTQEWVVPDELRAAAAPAHAQEPPLTAAPPHTAEAVQEPTPALPPEAAPERSPAPVPAPGPERASGRAPSQPAVAPVAARPVARRRKTGLPSRNAGLAAAAMLALVAVGAVAMAGLGDRDGAGTVPQVIDEVTAAPTQAQPAEADGGGESGGGKGKDNEDKGGGNGNGKGKGNGDGDD